MSASNKSSRIVSASSDNVLIPREKDYLNAKAYLLQPSAKSELSVYDFLAKLILKLFDENKSPVDVEAACRQLKRDLFKPKGTTLKVAEEPSLELLLAQVQKTLFECKIINLNHIDEDLEEKTKLPNLMQTFFYFEQAGIGFNREEVIRVWLAMKQLIDLHPIETVRFWGKLFGIRKNYYVVEAVMTEGKDNYQDEVDTEHELMELEKQRLEQEKAAELANEDKEVTDDPPTSVWKAPVTVPFEENGVGVNRKVYFVCNSPGERWYRLSKATPIQISSSRLIRKYLTGDLETEIDSYPPFPGKEKHYLRALISRITATTNISPLGFYTFDEEEEEAEEEEGASRSKFIEDPEFEPVPLRDLIDPSLANWVHHSQYIMPQGRTSWWNPASKVTEEIEEDEEDEEKEEMDEPTPESGPPLLTPINEDAEVNNLPPWSTKLSSYLIPQYAIAVVSSNLWPGAHAFATGKTFDNIYIGWGVKYLCPNFVPLALASVQGEYPSGPEIEEDIDPTVDEEAAFRAAQAQAMEQAEEDKEEEEGEEEEEEEGEED